MVLQIFCCCAENNHPSGFIAKEYTLTECFELDHGRTLLVTHSESSDSLRSPLVLLLLHRQGDTYRKEGQIPMTEGRIGCQSIDSCTFDITHHSKENIISTLTFTYTAASPCLLSAYSQDYIIQQEPELWYGNLYDTPPNIPFGEITPQLLAQIADGTIAEQPPKP